MSVSLLNQSKFKIYQDKVKSEDYFANLTTENILLANYDSKGYDDLTDNVVQYLTSNYPGLEKYQTGFLSFLRERGATRQVESARVRWKLKGSGKLQAFSKGNLQPENDYPGLEHSEFLLWLDVEWYRAGDTLSPEIDPRVQIVLQSDPVADGDGYRYSAQLATLEGSDYLDPEFLADGERWFKSGSSKYSEGSSGYGSFVYGGISWVEFETELNKTGKTAEFTDEAHKVSLRAQLWDNTYQKLLDLPEQVLTLAEAEFLAQIEWEKEQDVLWGRYAGRNIIDSTTGMYRRTAPGVFDFLDDVASYYPINGFSMDLLENELEVIGFDRIPKDQARIVVFTGREGLKGADIAIRRKYGESAVVSKYEDYVERVGPRNLMFKAPMFNAYEIPNYGVIVFEHLPALDDVSVGGPKHPVTGKPLRSSEYVIMDVGIGMGDLANVQALTRRNSKIMGYRCGTYSPAGPINSKDNKGFVITHPGRSFELFHGDEYGVFIKDITATRWIKPAAV